MLNSIAKYLWGGVDNETDYFERPGQKQPQVAPNGEHEDWILVDPVAKKDSASHHHQNLHRNCPHSHQHNSPHEHQPQPLHDSLLPPPQGCDTELLDDASALAFHLAAQSSASQISAAPEGHPSHAEHDSIESSDQEESGVESGLRPSSPESVFSTCSNRSHATYRPKGGASEPWVMAPPPCFTGSQIGESNPVESSYMENLLIEHPSMSVYYSVSASALPSAHPFLSLPAVTDPSHELGLVAGEENQDSQQEDQREDDNNRDVANHLGNHSAQVRHPRTAAIHPTQLLPGMLVAKAHAAQHQAISRRHRFISKQKCLRQNLVQEFNSTGKRNSRRNKRMRPSGCRTSRVSQRM